MYLAFHPEWRISLSRQDRLREYYQRFGKVYMRVLRTFSHGGSKTVRVLWWKAIVCTLWFELVSYVHSEKSKIGPILTHYWSRMISSLLDNIDNSIGSMFWSNMTQTCVRNIDITLIKFWSSHVSSMIYQKYWPNVVIPILAQGHITF